MPVGGSGSVFLGCLWRAPGDVEVGVLQGCPRGTAAELTYTCREAIAGGDEETLRWMQEEGLFDGSDHLWNYYLENNDYDASDASSDASYGYD